MRIRKSIVYVVVAIFLVIVAIIAATPWLVSTDLVRSAIEREMNTFTGRPVSIGGDVTVKLFPGPTAVFDDVNFVVRGNEEKSILTIERVEADIAPWTLLSRDPNFTAIRLTRPDLHLTRLADGSLNWQDVMGRIGTAVDMARERIEADAETQDLLIEEFPVGMALVGITDGRLTIDDLTNNTMEQVDSINGDINWANLNGGLTSRIEGTWRETPFSLQFSAAAPLAFFAGRATDAQLTIESAIGAVGFNGTIDLYETLFAGGQMNFSTPSTSSLLELFGAKIDPGRAIGSVAISGPINLSNQRLRFEQATLSIDDNAGSGALEINVPFDGPRTIAGTLEFKSLDLTSFLGAFITIPSSRAFFNPPINLNFMDQINTDLRLSAQSARFGKFEMAELAATAQINSAAAIFDIGDAIAYGGNVQARLQFNRDDQDKETALMSLSGQGVNTNLLGPALDLPRSLPLGVAQLSIDVETPLGSWLSMSQTAKGRLMFRMLDGATTGFGIETLQENSGSNQFFTLTNEDQGEEQFNSLNFEGSLADGIATIEVAEIDYAQGKVTLEGVAPFRSGGIALTATIQGLEGDSAEIPEQQFFIGGSWERAFATPLRVPDDFGE